MEAMDAYSQSKLAMTMWSKALANELKEKPPVIISVNPGSLLGSKMVKEGFGIPGKDISIGADIIVRASLDASFKSASGEYFDNDKGRFANPHLDALDGKKCKRILEIIEEFLIHKN